MSPTTLERIGLIGVQAIIVAGVMTLAVTAVGCSHDRRHGQGQAGASLAVSQPSKAIVVPDVIHVGVLARGGHIRQTLPIQNTSDAPLRRLVVKASCGCTMVGQVPDSIAPGQTAHVDYDIDASWWIVGGSAVKIWIGRVDEQPEETTLIFSVAEPFDMDSFTVDSDDAVLSIDDAYTYRATTLRGVCLDGEEEPLSGVAFDGRRLILPEQTLGKEVEIVYSLDPKPELKFSQRVTVPVPLEPLSERRTE